MNTNRQLHKLYFQYADNLSAIKRMKKQNEMLLLRIVKLSEQGYSLPLEAKVISVKQTLVRKHIRKGYAYLK